jgi:hypothetical protein
VIASSTVIDNLAYLIGAVVLALILVSLYAVRHRRPKSLEANVESFNRGLRALSPEAATRKGRRRNPAAEMTSKGPRWARTAMPLGRDIPSKTGDDRPEAGTG